MRRTARAAAAAVAAVVLAAGCGTVRYQAAAGPARSAAGHGHSHGRTTATATPGTPDFTKAQAERLARELLSRAPLPGGAQRRTGPPVQALARPPSMAAASPSVTLHELWTVGALMSAVNTFLTGHVPAGMASDGSGQTGFAVGVPQRASPPAKPRGGPPTGTAGSVTEEFVSYRLNSLPAGVSGATLTMSVAPTGPQTSELRADVQVTWYPPRSAAEYIPAGMHAVTITATLLSSRPAVITRTFSSPAVVRRLAALINGAHASSLGLVPCPMSQVSYRLAFAASPGTTPYLVADETGCLVLQMTVLNRAQPALQAPAALSTVLAALMHVRTVPGTGVLPPPCGKPPRGVWSGGGVPPGQPLAATAKMACPAIGPAAP
jgi:hypothetical protein